MRESPLLVGFSSNQTVYRRRLPLFNYLRELFGLGVCFSKGGGCVPYGIVGIVVIVILVIVVLQFL